MTKITELCTHQEVLCFFTLQFCHLQTVHKHTQGGEKGKKEREIERNEYLSSRVNPRVKRVLVLNMEHACRWNVDTCRRGRPWETQLPCRFPKDWFL